MSIDLIIQSNIGMQYVVQVCNIRNSRRKVLSDLQQSSLYGKYLEQNDVKIALHNL